MPNSFGNKVRRFVAPVGDLIISRDFVIEDSGQPDGFEQHAQEVPLEFLPSETLVYLLASRYCETDKLGDIAWQLFGSTPRGWSRVKAICDFVCGHLTFGYEYAKATRTAYEAYHERIGVCRDFAHLAVAFCRCMNIPARYANGFLGDIGVPPDPRRWTTTHGSRLISTGAGSPSTPATICLESAASPSRGDATPPTFRSRRRSASHSQRLPRLDDEVDRIARARPRAAQRLTAIHPRTNASTVAPGLHQPRFSVSRPLFAGSPLDGRLRHGHGSFRAALH